MSSHSHALSMPWAYSAETDARFSRIVRINLVVCLLLSIAMPWLPLPELQTPVTEEPPRLATFILEVKPLPPPPRSKPVVNPVPKQAVKPEAEPLVKKKAPPKKTVKQPSPAKQAVKPEPVKPVPVKPKVTARQQAEQAGLLALKDNLADMRQGTTASNLKKTSRLSQSGGQARKTERAVLTSGATRSSGGIQTTGLSRNTGGGELAARTTTQVHSPAANASGSAGGESTRGERAAGRSIEEIQMVFDRNKGAIYSIYNRALRQNPALQGKLVLQLTITPSGKVASCTVVSSELDDAVLNDKIAQRVKLFDFGVQDVNEVTITYPIDFLPA